MSEGIPIHFSGGILGGKTLTVPDLRPYYYAAVPPKPLPMMACPEGLPPVGPQIERHVYELWRRGDGTLFYRLIENLDKE